MKTLSHEELRRLGAPELPIGYEYRGRGHRRLGLKVEVVQYHRVIGRLQMRSIIAVEETSMAELSTLRRTVLDGFVALAVRCSDRAAEAVKRSELRRQLDEL